MKVGIHRVEYFPCDAEDMFFSSFAVFVKHITRATSDVMKIKKLLSKPNNLRLVQSTEIVRVNKVNAFKNNPRLDVSQHDFGSHLQLVTLVDVSSSDELLSNGFALRLIAGEQYGSTTGNHMGRARVYLRKK